MDLAYTLPLATAAAVLDVTLGYPLPLYRAIRHPVVWMRAWADALGGVRSGAAAGLYLAPILLASAALARLAPGPIGFALAAIVASTLLAQQALDRRVRAIARALEGGDLETARRAAVGLAGAGVGGDEADVVDAALEALARQFARGVVAPLFWTALAGLPGAALCKAVEIARGGGPAAAWLDSWFGAPGDAIGTLLLAAAARSTGPQGDSGPARAWALADRPGATLARAVGAEDVTPDASDLRRALALYRRAAAIEIFALAAGAAGAAAW